MPNQYLKNPLYTLRCFDLDNMFCRCKVCNSARQHQNKKYSHIDGDMKSLLENDFYDLLDENGNIKEFERFL